MSERPNTTKKMTSTTKPKSKKSKPAVLPPPAKSTERIADSDLESDSEEEEEQRLQYGRFTSLVGGGEAVANYACRDKTYSYQPPDDFAPLSSDDAARAADPFSAANLKGKQLWFFTAPANAPLSKLPSFSAADVTMGNVVLETKGGRSYCLKADRDILGAGTGVSLMAPDHKGVYRAGTRWSGWLLNRSTDSQLVGQPITKAFRIVESLPRPPKISKDDVPERQPIRLQPDGLRMRFRPFGSVGGDEAMAAGDAMDVDAPEVAHPEEGSLERKKKRHNSSRDGEKKKKKKHRSREE